VEHETDLDISVCRLPPGTSNWNKIEHRLFSCITTNWHGKPLTSHDTIMGLIGATNTGLLETARLYDDTYPTGITVIDRQIKELPITHPQGSLACPVRSPRSSKGTMARQN